ncbi:SAM-dependent methyltransferase [Amylibacter marinus]|uniref:SAM-dependent methyltransferase n=1 Tax=Amylibacter marinus TaxID=1475483 RepID=A0ABQ5VW73_9RHOB|nr:SAM-dependent methyltransferase [Amylibacter marinus]GLQ35559.1 SAM-dependent methyltransferase [Amylibacter marinus]
MDTPPNLFETDTLALRRARADGTAWFLQDAALDEIHERIQDVNRTFKNVAIIGPRANIWAERLGLEATCIPDRDFLGLGEAQYDLIIHAMALHWANDPIGQLVQMRRALVPDGLMLAVSFGGQTLNELRISFAQAETRVLGGISPRVAPMGELREMGALLQRAQLALPVADALPLTVSYENALRLMHDLRAMGETNVMCARHKTPISKPLLAEVMREYQSSFAVEGRIQASFELIFLSGWAPSRTQQQPLKPGSAQVRLADALGTLEINPDKP